MSSFTEAIIGSVKPVACKKMSDPKSSTKVPLVVDVDGTLLRTDLLLESAFALMAAAPQTSLMLLVWLSQGKACLKRRVAERTDIPFGTIPMNETLLEFLKAERAKGRQLYLA